MNANMFFIRTATEQDLPTVRQLLIDTWHATYDGIYGADKVDEITGDWHALEKLQARRQQPNAEFLVADNGKTIGGMAFASHADKVIKLHQLYVHPDHQGTGAGFHLMVEIENAFPGAQVIRLEVEEKNETALGFYRKYGFEVMDRTANCGAEGSGIPALIMEKPVVYVED